MAERTPEPWFWNDDGEHIVIGCEGGSIIAEMAVYRGSDRGIQIANAAHIVLCVNSHDELVTALADILDGLDKSWAHHYPELLKAARAALKAVGGADHGM